jgi:hypothetical protein
VGQKGIFEGRVCPAYDAPTPGTPSGTTPQPAEDYTNWIFKDDTSRDQNMGTLIGLAAIIRYVDNPGLQARAARYICEILDFLIANNWFVTHQTLDGSDRFTNGADFDPGVLSTGWARLSLLQVGRQVAPEKYDALFWEAFGLRHQYLKLWAENIRRYSIGEYFPLNLLWLTTWMLLAFVEPGDPLYEPLQIALRDHVYFPVRNHRNAWFQSLYLLLSRDYQPLDEPQVVVEIRDALQRMSGARAQHFNGMWAQPFAELDLNLSDPADRATLYRPVYQELGHSLAFIEEFGASILPTEELARFPIPINYRSQYDFPWQFNPYRLVHHNPSNHVEYYHTELTVVYWIARHLGIVGAPTEVFVPRSVPQAEGAGYWPHLTFPAAYHTTTTVLEAYGL